MCDFTVTFWFVIMLIFLLTLFMLGVGIMIGLGWEKRRIAPLEDELENERLARHAMMTGPHPD